MMFAFHDDLEGNATGAEPSGRITDPTEAEGLDARRNGVLNPRGCGLEVRVATSARIIL